MGIKPTYSVAELAKLLGWTKQKVHRWLTFRNVQKIHIAEKKFLIPLKALMNADPALFDSMVAAGQLLGEKK